MDEGKSETVDDEEGKEEIIVFFNSKEFLYYLYICNCASCLLCK